MQKKSKKIYIFLKLQTSNEVRGKIYQILQNFRENIKKMIF